MRDTWQNNLGQGLIETTVAIGIIITAIVGSVTLVNYTLRSTTTTANRLLASQLALEGIEVAVNLRDSNYVAGNNFDTGLVSGSDQTAIAVFDPTANQWALNFTPNSLDADATVLYREGGLYVQDTTTPAGSETMFRRLLTIDSSVSGRLAVTSTVRWTQRGDTRELEVERTLYDWR